MADAKLLACVKETRSKADHQAIKRLILEQRELKERRLWAQAETIAAVRFHKGRGMSEKRLIELYGRGLIEQVKKADDLISVEG
jgi:hypothetical protein